MSNIKKELTASKATSEEFVNALSLLLKGETSFNLMEAENSLLLNLDLLGILLLQIKRGFQADIHGYRVQSTTLATSVAGLRLDAAKFEAAISEAWEDFLGVPFPGFDQVRCFGQSTTLVLPTFGGTLPSAFVMWNRVHRCACPRVTEVTFRFDDETWSTLKELWEEHSQMLKAFGN